MTSARFVPAEITGFLHYKRIVGLSPRTLEAYERDLAAFSSWLSPKTPAEACLEDVRKYLAACWKLKLNPATVARRISVLRELFKHLLRDAVIERDPMLRIESVHRWKRLPKAISEIEIRQLLDSFGQPQSPLALRDRAMLETLYASAVRVDELVSAKLADLNLEQRCLLVSGKGSKQRLVPLGAPAAYALSSYLAKGRPVLDHCEACGKAEAGHQKADHPWKASPFLFVGSLGTQQITRQRVFQIVRRLGRQFNLPGLSPHVMRHSAATHMLEHHADLRVIQTILGHAEIETSQLYTKVTLEHLRDAMTRHPRNSPKRLQTRLFDDFVSNTLAGPSPCTFPALAPNPIPCIECASPAVKGKARCERHRQASLAAGRRFRERAKLRKPEALAQNKMQGSCFIRLTPEPICA
jgi:integrase/recombinase XerD